MRYTIKNLNAFVSKLNEDLSNADYAYRLVVEQFNGTTWISCATPDDVKRHRTHSRIDCGTPRHCANVASDYVRVALTK